MKLFKQKLLLTILISALMVTPIFASNKISLDQAKMVKDNKVVSYDNNKKINVNIVFFKHR